MTEKNQEDESCQGDGIYSLFDSDFCADFESQRDFLV